jgi:integrase
VAWEQDGHTKVGLRPIRLHDIRHSYATAALAAGIPAKIVSERLGHANVQITLDTYQPSSAMSCRAAASSGPTLAAWRRAAA